VSDLAGARGLADPRLRHVEELGGAGVVEEAIGQRFGRKLGAQRFTPRLSLGFGNRSRGPLRLGQRLDGGKQLRQIRNLDGDPLPRRMVDVFSPAR